MQTEPNTPPASEELILLRERLAVLESKVDAPIVEPRPVQETAIATGGLNQFVDYRDFMPREFGLGGGLAALGGLVLNRATDKDEGKNEPFIRTESDLQATRGFARLVTTATCPGTGIVENLRNYIIGTGLIVSVAAKKGRKVPDGLVDAITDVVDEFNEENKISGDLDREMEGQSRIDGEWFMTVTPKRERRQSAVVRMVEPSCVGDPGRPIWTPEEFWSRYRVSVPYPTLSKWGVHCDEHDIQNVHGFYVQWNCDGVFDYVPKSYCHHLKLNVTRNVSRGLSDFYPAWQWLKQQERLLKNTGEGAAELAAISYIIQYAEATREQVTAMRVEGPTLPHSRPTANGSTPAYKVRREPGTVLDVGRGQEYKPGPMGAERGQAFVEVVQAILRQVGTRWCMPEGMISGDYSNANLASSVEAGSQFHKFATAAQAKSSTNWVEMFWIAVRIAFDAGVFDRFNMSFAEIKRAITITVTYPTVEVRKPLEIAETNKVEFESKVLSRKTWCEESGRDFETEEANIEADPLAQSSDPMGGGGGGMFGGGGAPGGGAGMGGGGEYQNMSRRQFTNNAKAIQDILTKVTDGEFSAERGKQFLLSLGLPPDRAEALLADIADDGALTPANLQSIAESAAIYVYDRLVLE